MTVGKDIHMHSSLADLFKFYLYLALILKLSFMFLAPGLEMPLLLTDSFIISQHFPGECIENCFSCSRRVIKWAESAVQKKKKKNF